MAVRRFVVKISELGFDIASKVGGVLGGLAVSEHDWR
jgi:hypothetical protein